MPDVVTVSSRPLGKSGLIEPRLAGVDLSLKIRVPSMDSIIALIICPFSISFGIFFKLSRRIVQSQISPANSRYLEYLFPATHRLRFEGKQSCCALRLTFYKRIPSAGTKGVGGALYELRSRAVGCGNGVF